MRWNTSLSHFLCSRSCRWCAASTRDSFSASKVATKPWRSCSNCSNRSFLAFSRCLRANSASCQNTHSAKVRMRSLRTRASSMARVCVCVSVCVCVHCICSCICMLSTTGIRFIGFVMRGWPWVIECMCMGRERGGTSWQLAWAVGWAEQLCDHCIRVLGDTHREGGCEISSSWVSRRPEIPPCCQSATHWVDSRRSTPTSAPPRLPPGQSQAPYARKPGYLSTRRHAHTAQGRCLSITQR